MFRGILLATVVAMTGGAALAEDRMKRVEAAGSVAEAADRLTAVVEGAGAKVFARVNHGGGAASVDMELEDAELIVLSLIHI